MHHKLKFSIIVVTPECLGSLQTWSAKNWVVADTADKHEAPHHNHQPLPSEQLAGAFPGPSSRVHGVDCGGDDWPPVYPNPNAGLGMARLQIAEKRRGVEKLGEITSPFHGKPYYQVPFDDSDTSTEITECRRSATGREV